MERNTFAALEDDAIGHACFEPMVPVYQSGMRGLNGKAAAEYRTGFYKMLSPGQRALFMFFTYYDHAIRTADEFQRISSHYLSSQIFGAVKKGISYFHDDDMLELLSHIEQAVSENDKGRISDLYHRLKTISPKTLAAIGAHIRENPAEFINLD